MDHDAIGPTDEERQALAQIELGLQRRAPDLAVSFRRHTRPLQRPRLSARVARRVWWVVAALGSGLVGGGLWIEAVAVATAGWLAVLVALYVLTADIELSRSLQGLRRWLGLVETRPPRRGLR